MLNYYQFINEINKEDIDIVKHSNIEKKFTISYEIELETNSNENIYFKNYDLDEIEEDIIEDYNLENDEENLLFTQEIITNLKNSNNKEIFNILTLEYEDETKSDIINNLWSFLINREKDISYLKNKIKENFPNLYKNYSNKLIFEKDDALYRGIELHPKTYFNGLNEAMEFIILFFKEYEEQNYFKFSERTCIHINIGLKKFTNLNLLKGIMFLDDFKKNDMDIPYVFKGNIERIDNKFCTSIRNILIPIAKKIINNIEKWDLIEIEKQINIELTKYFSKDIEKEEYSDLKNIGLNLYYLFQRNYVEFRYLGKELDLEVVISKLLYFCWIISLMSSVKEYKRKKYLNKLYKFIDNLK